MLKTAVLDCVINEKCCSVDEGRVICPLFSSQPRGQPAGGGGGRGWAQLELTDA